MSFRLVSSRQQWGWNLIELDAKMAKLISDIKLLDSMDFFSGGNITGGAC